ncbi:MAG TPA: glycosyltransferase, partial [Sulfitobacter sp.]|nr:glycosyltransferase [Sulfitobacter sp.]
MALMFRWLIRLAVFLVTLSVVVLLLVYWFAARSLPDYDDTVEVRGVTAPVEVVRDNANVPHIFGETDADVFFGLGFAHAQDRLWQLITLRRTAQGRLSEVFGPATAIVTRVNFTEPGRYVLRLSVSDGELSVSDEVVVVDSHSVDRTRELAAASGARVIERDWPGHVKQKEFTIRQAENEWVLCVDADARISDELRAEIVALQSAGFPGKSGWRMPRMSRYLGQWIRHGTWYPDRQLRLFDRRRGYWSGHDP